MAYQHGTSGLSPAVGTQWPLCARSTAGATGAQRHFRNVMRRVTRDRRDVFGTPRCERRFRAPQLVIQKERDQQMVKVMVPVNAKSWIIRE